mmetsp:Transcript_27825/g.49713  ORF Transcript_27825/g.49713 Transcript_27825/m.49713 type:complete len:275 (-) Transcript_27825:154-978(-)
MSLLTSALSGTIRPGFMRLAGTALPPVGAVPLARGIRSAVTVPSCGGGGSRRCSSGATAPLRRGGKVAAFAGVEAGAVASASVTSLHPSIGVTEIADGLESPIQGFYLFTLLSVLVVGAFLVVRQVLVRNELEETIKVLGERKRRGEATAEDYFELGVVLVRKKLYTQATQNLRTAQKMWDGEPEELAQVHNAIGFSFFNMGKYPDAVKEYKKAVELQPGYVTAWNNLGDAFEAQKSYKEAVDCYTEVLSYAPDNNVARSRKEYLSTKLSRRGA